MAIQSVKALVVGDGFSIVDLLKFLRYLGVKEVYIPEDLKSQPLSLVHLDELQLLEVGKDFRLYIQNEQMDVPHPVYEASLDEVPNNVTQFCMSCII